jgi:hypothetical protein
VKSVDKGTKTMVVKTSDGTDHTIKWTDRTTVKGIDASGKAVAAGSVETYDGLKEGAKVSVKYTEKGGDKTAVAIRDASKATAKAMAQVMDGEEARTRTAGCASILRNTAMPVAVDQMRVRPDPQSTSAPEASSDKALPHPQDSGLPVIFERRRTAG